MTSRPSARASLSAAKAALDEAVANRDKQEVTTKRVVSLAEQGVMSAQDKDTAVESSKAAVAHVQAARDQVAAADAAIGPTRPSTKETATTTMVMVDFLYNAFMLVGDLFPDH